MKNPLILTFDIGTQSTRAMIIDTQGSIVKKVQKKHEKPYYSSAPGRAEQSADFYWQSVCDTSLALKSEAKERWEDILAVTVTTMRDCGVCVNSEGKPLRDVILWMDKREAENLPPIPLFQKLAFGIVGMLESVKLQRKMSVCNWIMINQPEIWKDTHKFLMLSTYLSYKLTGNFTDSIASLIGHIPFNSKARTWMTKNDLKRCIFDIPREKLCDIVEPGEVLGLVTKQASEETGILCGMEIIATGSDKGCETLGLSCTAPDKAALSFGTTATVQFATKRYMEPLPFIPSYPAILKGSYNPEVQISRGYWLVSWFKKEFAEKEMKQAQEIGISAEQLLNARLKEIPAGCEGLIFQPYFTPGIVMPNARGAIIGFSDVHSRIHIYRAIIEGINFALIEGLRTMERRGKVQIRKLFVAGGGAQSDEICQITANMFGLPVYRIQTHEASGLGSSMVAFVAKGVFSDVEAAIGEMVHISKEFPPNMVENKIYEKLYRDIYSKIFKKLLPLYKKDI